MRNGKRIGVVIPALNEEKAIGKVIADIPPWVDAIVVADNGSSDRTAAVAKATSALVVREEERGYGAACQAGLAALPTSDIVVFLDGDYSDYPDDMHLLVDPIATGEVDLVIGSRALGEAQSWALTPPQVFGNWLATRLIHLIWGARFTDLGPFRAIRAICLQRLRMADRDYGWTVEMQIKAAKSGLRCAEVPVRYRRRVGISKISGTIRGSMKAGMKILAVIGRHAIRQERASSLGGN